MRVLEVRDEQVICQVGNKITTRPNSPYYSLRYFHYDGQQIGYIFSDDCYVRETFDDRIFNCWCKGVRFQLRQELSENLAKAIKNHMEFGNLQEYVDLFQIAWEEEPDWPMLDVYLNNVEGVERTNIGFVVNQSFLIDFKGNAWVRDEEAEEKRNHVFADQKTSPMDGWTSLCIVMQDSGHSYKATEGQLVDNAGNLQKASSLTMTIITKIIFLLNPNLDDTAFTGQLSKNLLARLRNMI